LDDATKQMNIAISTKGMMPPRPASATRNRTKSNILNQRKNQSRTALRRWGCKWGLQLGTKSTADADGSLDELRRQAAPCEKPRLASIRQDVKSPADMSDDELAATLAAAREIASDEGAELSPSGMRH
jgi:hypothetical protein